MPLDLLGAACSAIDKKRDAPNVLSKLRAITMGVPLASHNERDAKLTDEKVELALNAWFTVTVDDTFETRMRAAFAAAKEKK